MVIKLTLEEFVLTYKNSEGNLVITVEAYYERYVKPLSPKFKQSSFAGGSSKVLCCFHDDKRPSMGLMASTKYPGVKLYHCFGCGAIGTVIRFHQRVQREYYNRRLTETEAAKELCVLFGVDTEQYKTKVYEGDNAVYMKRVAYIGKNIGRYDIHAFKNELCDVRSDDTLTIDKKINKLNSAMVRYIATTKKMYD